MLFSLVVDTNRYIPLAPAAPDQGQDLTVLNREEIEVKAHVSMLMMHWGRGEVWLGGL
jgi:hypothetical protein